MRREQEQESLYKDDWWLEHLEEELEPNLQEDLELLLKNSKADRQILQSLQRTRDLVKESDDVLMPESGHYYNDLHSRIMAAIDEEAAPVSGVSSGSLKKSSFARRGRAVWPTIFGTSTLAILMAFVSWYSIGSRDAQVAALKTVNAHIDREIAAVSGIVPAAFSDSVLGYESESDFVADALAHRLKSLDSRDAEEIFKRIKN